MRFPNITNLYGRIFAIFWFTMALVLLAVLSLPHLDPRKVRDIPAEHLQRMDQAREHIKQRFALHTELQTVLAALDNDNQTTRTAKPRLFLTDDEGTILTTRRHPDFMLRALQNFVTSMDEDPQPKQRLYGRYMISGPLPITLAKQKLNLYFGYRWDEPPPFLLRLFDKPFQLLLVVMLVSTPLLLWLAWALSRPARQLELAARRVAKGEFERDPSLETGTTEFRQAGASFNQMVQAVNQMISGQQRLLSDISHELRSPLTRLRMANALAERKLGATPELTRIDTEAQRLETMIGDLLNLSRMQVDSHKNHETQPLSSLWETLLDDTQFEAEQLGKRLTFSPIPERSISGNPPLLISALENLIRNAIYYGHDEIRVQMRAEADTLSITVEDNGDGVPEEELHDIFRPFYRVSTARDRHSGGTGLGLAITENAVRQHNGRIIASRSELGGLKMQIELPLMA